MILFGSAQKKIFIYEMRMWAKFSFKFKFKIMRFIQMQIFQRIVKTEGQRKIR